MKYTKLSKIESIKASFDEAVRASKNSSKQWVQFYDSIFGAMGFYIYLLSISFLKIIVLVLMIILINRGHLRKKVTNIHFCEPKIERYYFFEKTDKFLPRTGAFSGSNDRMY